MGTRNTELVSAINDIAYMRKGFTLIELLIVITLIGGISIAIVSQMSGSTDEYDLESALVVASADIRQIIVWAQTGRVCCEGDPNQEVPTGYGIYFATGQDSYVLYADNDGDKVYDTGEAFKTVDFSATERIENVEVYACNQCDIYADVPTGQIYTDGDQNTNANIEIRNTASGDSNIISVNVNSGQVTY